MKKILITALGVVVTFALVASAFAVPAGKTVEFDGKGGGKVVFDGKAHVKSGSKCKDCHASGLFKMKKGAAAITMKEMDEGKFCGGCHNGTKAFSSKDPEKCEKCHAKECEPQKEQRISGIVTDFDDKTNTVTIRKKDKTKVTLVIKNEKLARGVAKGKRYAATYITKDGINVIIKMRDKGGC